MLRELIPAMVGFKAQVTVLGFISMTQFYSTTEPFLYFDLICFRIL